MPQALPAGVFADPFELAGLEALGGSSGGGLGRCARARVFGPVDLEALEPHASPTVLALWGPAEPCPAGQARAGSVGVPPSGRPAAASPQGFRGGCNAGRCSPGCAAQGPGIGAAGMRQHVCDASESDDGSSSRQFGSCRGAACCHRAALHPAPGNRSAAASLQAACSGAVTMALRLQAPLHARYAAPRLPADGSGWASFAGEPAAYVLPAPLVLARLGRRCQGKSTNSVDSVAESHPWGPGAWSREAAWTESDSSSCRGRGGVAASRGPCGPPAGLGPSRWEVVRALQGAGPAEARWHVPTGNPAHESFVAAATAAAFLLAGALIVRAAFAASRQ